MPRKHKRYRQGDVVLKEVRKVPEWALPSQVVPLAIGEQTGHSHRIEGGDVAFFGDADMRFIEVKTEATLIHEEHKPLTIAPGRYLQLGEREYDYINEQPQAEYD